MDEEQQSSVWPPAPQTEPPPSPINVSAFKPAPTRWVINLTLITVGILLVQCLCDLDLSFDPESPVFSTLDAWLIKPWNQTATIAFVAFLVWFYRSYKNLAVFETAELRDSPGWAVGWFFVPILSFFRPYRSMQALWKASDPGADSRDVESWRSVPAGRTVAFWWGLTLLTEVYFFGFITYIFALKPSGSHTRLATAGYALLSCLTNIAIVFLIRGISARQQEKALLLLAAAAQKPQAMSAQEH